MGASIPRRVRAAGLWVLEEHLLVSRAIGHQRWAVVGGGLEPGESAYQACEREFREEVGVEVRCERLAMVGDIIIRPDLRPDQALEQDVSFYFIVSSARDTSLASVSSQEPGLEVGWIPLAELSHTPLVPHVLDVLIPRALAGQAALYFSYDCRTDPDEHEGTEIWPARGDR
jgi:ADP-ribose pyrophosphatase YjhB (NUDIX family)